MLLETLIYIDGAYAPSTIRAYRANFQRFIEFSEGLRSNALPAHPRNVANYVAHLTMIGLKSASIRIAVASISSIHKFNGFDDPTQKPEVRLALRRMHRTLGRTSKQAFAIRAPVLEKMIMATKNDMRGFRDRCLIMIAYDSLCRRGELTSLRYDDIEWSETGLPVNIRLRKSKTDQEAIGKLLRLTTKTQWAIKNWIDCAKIIEGHLFRGIKNNGDISQGLNPNQINRIYKSLASAANLSKEQIEGISGHSIRVGAAQDLMMSGASLPVLMVRGRWSKPDTALRYTEFVIPEELQIHQL